MTTDNTHSHERPVPEAFAQPYSAPVHTPAHLAAQAAQAQAYAEADAFGSGQIPEGRHMAPVAALPPSEFLMSLTGFDEIAVAARFGRAVTALREDPIECGRALAFTHYRRAGMNDNDAHNAALSLTLREVTEFFPPEPVIASAEGNGDGA